MRDNQLIIIHCLLRQDYDVIANYMFGNGIVDRSKGTGKWLNEFQNSLNWTAIIKSNELFFPGQ